MKIADGFFINLMYGLRSLFEQNASSYMPKNYRDKIKAKVFDWDYSSRRSIGAGKGVFARPIFPGPYFVVFEDRTGGINYDFSYSRFVINRIYSKKISESMKAVRLCVELDSDIPLLGSVADFYKIKLGHDKCYHE